MTKYAEQISTSYCTASLQRAVAGIVRRERASQSVLHQNVISVRSKIYKLLNKLSVCYVNSLQATVLLCDPIGQ